MPDDRRKPTGPAWVGYAFAAVITAALLLLRVQVEQWIGVRISLPLCGLAAVFACIWQAGLGPALLATLLTTAWYVWDSGPPGPYAWIHYALYLSEAGVFCFYGRQLRLARDYAAQGEDWQRHLVQTAGEGIWLVDPDGVISYANPRIAEILGCGAEEITGRKVEAFLFPEDLAAERIRFQNRRASIKEQYDRRLRRADGSEVWTLASSSPYSHRGKDAGVLTMMTDITQRKKAEHALRSSERKFRELFENIREGVYQTSPDGRILAANPELLRMLGFSSQEELNVVGVVKDTFVESGLHQSLRDRLERDGSYANVEFQLRTRDHRIVTVTENARVVRDENGNVLYYEGTLTDITEKLRFEKQLRQAQKMEALGRLAGGIARDFRAIGDGMVDGLHRALNVLPADSPARPRLHSVVRSLNSAEALTRQILNFSQRLAIGTSDRHRAAMDVNALVLSLEPSLRRLADTGNSLDLSLCTEPAPVLADPGNMQQILTSLIIYVRDFGRGAKRIEIRTLIEASAPAGSGTAVGAGPFVSLSVQAERFEAAARDDTNLPPWFGMETSQAIIAQYGGMLTTGLGLGTVRYSLYLPIAPMTRLARAEVDTSLPSPAAHSAVTVLLVEEEPMIRELSRDMLERQGFSVLTAGSAAEAERMAREKQPFDVLITDQAAAGDKGAVAVRLLREMRPELRVLFIAGYSGSSSDSIALPERAGILRKPFSGDSLGRKIRELLDTSG